MSIDSSRFEHRGSRWIWRYVLPIGVIAASAMVAHAFDTSWIAPNQPISATSLKSDLDEIGTRLATLEGSAAGYPAVDSAVFGDGEWCGSAPSSFSLANDASTFSAAFGRLITTNEGAFAQNLTLPVAAANCPASTFCHGPITFFLLNPGIARSITLSVNIDNGPSFIYVDGNGGANKFISPPLANIANANVTIPSGPFALSVIACSNDGPSMNIVISNKFITANGLTVDYDRTFHRAGK